MNIKTELKDIKSKIAKLQAEMNRIKQVRKQDPLVKIWDNKHDEHWNKY